ncbi:MAG: hypothetical protein JWO95_1446 [Verrucomicrobiales bacterium]|nr:hypothetical protein [Verrucomicrobiales bacterium]
MIADGIAGIVARFSDEYENAQSQLGPTEANHAGALYTHRDLASRRDDIDRISPPGFLTFYRLLS